MMMKHILIECCKIVLLAVFLYRLWFIWLTIIGFNSFHAIYVGHVNFKFECDFIKYICMMLTKTAILVAISPTVLLYETLAICLQFLVENHIEIENVEISTTKTINISILKCQIIGHNKNKRRIKGPKKCTI